MEKWRAEMVESLPGWAEFVNTPQTAAEKRAAGSIEWEESPDRPAVDGLIHQTLIASVCTGRRNGYPVENFLYRVTRNGKTLNWAIVWGVCNGIAMGAHEYRSKKSALADLT